MAADLEIGVSINARGTKAGGAEARREIKSVGDEAERTSRKVSAASQSMVQVDRAAAEAAKRLNIPYKEYVASLGARQKAFLAHADGLKKVDKAQQATTDSVKKLTAAKQRLSPVLREVGNALDATAGQAGFAAGAMSRLTTAAGPVGIAIAAVTIIIGAGIIAMVAMTAAVIKLAKAYADYAIEVGNAAEANGLAVQTQAALTHEMAAQGREAVGLEGAMANLRKTIGEASAGSVEARKNLKLLGIDATTAAHDIDGAFRQAVKSILEAPNATEQMRRGFAAFGDDFQKLLPFLKDMGGDVDAVIERARELGIVIGDDNVASAREFNRAYANVAAQLQQILHLFGKEFLPVIERVLSRFSYWLNNNSDGMRNLAQVSAWGIGQTIEWLESLKRWVDDHPYVFTAVEAAALGPAALGARIAGGTLGRAIRDKANSLPLAGQIGGDALGIDPGVFNAARNYKAPKTKAAKLNDEQKQAQAMTKLIADLGREIEFYGDKSKVAAVKQQILSLGVKDLNSGLAQQAIALAGNIDKLDAEAEATKKAADAQKKYQETFSQFAKSLADSKFGERLGLKTDIVTLEKQLQLGRELTDQEKGFIANAAELESVSRAARQAGLKDEDVKRILAAVVAEQQMTDELREQLDVLLKRLKAREDEERLNKAVTGLNADLAAELAELNEVYRTGAEVTMVFRVQQELLKDTYKGLTEAQRDDLLASAARVDQMREALKAQAEAQRQYDEFRNTILDGLDALEGGWGNFFKWMANRFKQMLKEMVADWLTSQFFQLFFKGGNQQIAGQNGSRGGFLGAIFQSVSGIFGRGAGGSAANGPGGTPYFNPSNFAGGDGSIFSQIPGATGSIDANGNYVVNGNQGGGALGGLGGLGGLKGLFGKGGLTQLAGMLPFIGGGLGKKFGGPLGLIGGALLGATGFAALGGFGALASAGAISGSTGLAATALLINPFTIAAGVGLIVGGILLRRNRLRRKEERQRNQAMLDAFSALKQFDTLIADVRGLRLDPASGIAQGEQLGQQVREQYLQLANSLKDKKTRNHALADVRRIDAIITAKMAELRAVADIATAAGERNRRLLPEFAGGIYLSPAFQAFRRQNGMLAGAWTGRDTIPAMLARGEMVLNPMQQASVVRNAGFDVFKTAAIPGYAGGGIINNIQPAAVTMPDVHVTVLVEQDASGLWQATAQSDAGQKVIAKVVENKHLNGELKLKRR